MKRLTLISTVVVLLTAALAAQEPTHDHHREAAGQITWDCTALPPTPFTDLDPNSPLSFDLPAPQSGDNCSVKINDLYGTGGLGGRFPVTPGQLATFSFWQRVHATQGYVAMSFYDAAGVPVPSSTQVILSAGDDLWTFRSIGGVAPPTAVEVRVHLSVLMYFHLKDSAVWYDAVKLEVK